MLRTDNPIADFNAWDEEQNRHLERCPKCDYCGNHIQDEHLYDIEGTLICEGCMEANFKKSTENYMN